MGSAIYAEIMQTEPDAGIYNSTVLREYDLTTAGMSCMFGRTQPTNASFTFGDCDYLNSFTLARMNGTFRYACVPKFWTHRTQTYCLCDTSVREKAWRSRKRVAQAT